MTTKPNNNLSFKFVSITEPNAEVVSETDAQGNRFYYALESTGKRLVASEIMEVTHD